MTASSESPDSRRGCPERGETLRYVSFRSASITLFFALAPNGICRVSFDERGLLEFLQSAQIRWGVKPKRLRGLPEEIALPFSRYLNGSGPLPPLPVEVWTGTPFQIRAWEQLRAIPHGQTRSYQWLAARMGRPGLARAVGRACAANPLPVLVPCHRVLRSDGRLGGFTAGPEVKRLLLQLERAII